MEEGGGASWRWKERAATNPQKQQGSGQELKRKGATNPPKKQGSGQELKRKGILSSILSRAWKSDLFTDACLHPNSRNQQLTNV